MRELNFALQRAGYKTTFQYGGITVELPAVTIAIGKDDDKEGLFMVNIQEDLESGPEYKSMDDVSRADVMTLCASYASSSVPAQSPAPALV